MGFLRGSLSIDRNGPGEYVCTIKQTTQTMETLVTHAQQMTIIVVITLATISLIVYAIRDDRKQKKGGVA